MGRNINCLGGKSRIKLMYIPLVLRITIGRCALAVSYSNATIRYNSPRSALKFSLSTSHQHHRALSQSAFLVKRRTRQRNKQTIRIYKPVPVGLKSNRGQWPRAITMTGESDLKSGLDDHEARLPSQEPPP